MYYLIRHPEAQIHAHTRVVRLVKLLPEAEVTRLFKKLLITNQINYIKLLPVVLYHYIVSFLAWPNVARLRSVCRSWNCAVASWPWRSLPFAMWYLRDGTARVCPEYEVLWSSVADGFSSLTSCSSILCRQEIPSYRGIRTVEIPVNLWNITYSKAFSSVPLTNITIFTPEIDITHGHPTCTYLNLRGKSYMHCIDLSLWPCLLTLEARNMKLSTSRLIIPDSHPLRNIIFGNANIATLIYHPNILSRLQEICISPFWKLEERMSNVSTLKIAEEYSAFTDASDTIAQFLPNVTSLDLFVTSEKQFWTKPNGWLHDCLFTWSNVTTLCISGRFETGMNVFAMSTKLLLNLKTVTLFRGHHARECYRKVHDLPACRSLTHLTTCIKLAFSSAEILINRFPSLAFLKAPLPVPLAREIERMIVEKEYPLELKVQKNQVHPLLSH